MTEINVIDAEVVVPLDIAAAKRLDQRIRLLVSSISDSIDKLHDLVAEAKRGDAHTALGYRSWTEYIASVFTVQVRLDREQRRELVGYLSGEGMSQRAIADVVGVDQKTVSNDLRSGEENSSPEPDPGMPDVFADADEAADVMAMTDMTDAQFEAVLSDARAEGDMSRENVAQKCRARTATPVTGLDGKAYRRKAKPRNIKPAAGAAMGEEEAMRAAARAAELSAWGKACDGLLAALSYAASSRPPEDTDRYPTVAVFIERYQALGEHITKWAETTKAVAQ